MVAPSNAYLMRAILAISGARAEDNRITKLSSSILAGLVALLLRGVRVRKEAFRAQAECYLAGRFTRTGTLCGSAV